MTFDDHRKDRELKPRTARVDLERVVNRRRYIWALGACLVVGGLAAFIVDRHSAPSTLVERCSEIQAASDRVRCWSDALLVTAKRDGDAATLRRVARIERQWPGFRTDCHTALHPVGEQSGRRAAPDQMPSTGAEELPGCRQGYLHGWFLGRAADDPTTDADQEAARCDARPDSEVGDCAHAIGHLLLRDSGGAVPTALERCGAFDATGRQVQLDQCGWGVFMEAALLDALGTTTSNPRCDRLAERWRDLCYRFEPSRRSWEGERWTDIADHCSDANDAARTPCASGLGFAVSDREVCERLDDDLGDICRRAARAGADVP